MHERRPAAQPPRPRATPDLPPTDYAERFFSRELGDAISTYPPPGTLLEVMDRGWAPPWMGPNPPLLLWCRRTGVDSFSTPPSYYLVQLLMAWGQSPHGDVLPVAGRLEAYGWQEAELRESLAFAHQASHQRASAGPSPIIPPRDDERSEMEESLQPRYAPGQPASSGGVPLGPPPARPHDDGPSGSSFSAQGASSSFSGAHPQPAGASDVTIPAGDAAATAPAATQVVQPAVRGETAAPAAAAPAVLMAAAEGMAAPPAADAAGNPVLNQEIPINLPPVFVAKPDGTLVPHQELSPEAGPTASPSIEEMYAGLDAPATEIQGGLVAGPPRPPTMEPPAGPGPPPGGPAAAAAAALQHTQDVSALQYKLSRIATAHEMQSKQFRWAEENAANEAARREAELQQLSEAHQSEIVQLRSGAGAQLQNMAATHQQQLGELRVQGGARERALQADLEVTKSSWLRQVQDLTSQIEQLQGARAQEHAQLMALQEARAQPPPPVPPQPRAPAPVFQPEQVLAPKAPPIGFAQPRPPAFPPPGTGSQPFPWPAPPVMGVPQPQLGPPAVQGPAGPPGGSALVPAGTIGAPGAQLGLAPPMFPGDNMIQQSEFLQRSRPDGTIDTSVRTMTWAGPPQPEIRPPPPQPAGPPPPIAGAGAVPPRG